MENRRTKYIFIVLIVLSVLMIVFSSVRDGLMNPIRNTIGYVLVPLQTGVNRIGSGLYRSLRDSRTMDELRSENDSLKQQLGVLTEENNILKQNDEELKRLEDLYQLDQDYLQYKKVAARIIAKDSENWFQVFRIDKGSQDGIRVDQNVMANGGLVGIVTDVGLNYATVRSIIDDESRVSAMSLSSSDTCIVAGDLTLYEEGRLRITDLDKNSSIQDGDRIVTSNISSKFMPGILIGYAADIHDDEKHLMKNGYLIPAANFDDMTDVLVVLDVKSDQFLDENPGSESVPAEDNIPEGTENAATESQSSTGESASSLVESLAEVYQNGQSSPEPETESGGAALPDALADETAGSGESESADTQQIGSGGSSEATG